MLELGVELGHRGLREVPVLGGQRLLVGDEEDGTREVDEGGLGREDPDHPVSARALLVQALQWVGGPDLPPVGPGEGLMATVGSTGVVFEG